MDEVKKAESEGSAGASKQGWEPLCVKKLSAAVVGDAVFAEAVGDLQSVDTRDVK